MKRWVRFLFEDQIGTGILTSAGEAIVRYDCPHIGQGEALDQTLPIGEVNLLTPTEPGKFIGLWNNFRELATKLRQAIPEEPLFFFKSPNSYLPPGGIIRSPATYNGRIFYEGELGIVIGRSCRAVNEAEAPEYILGYTCVNDVTAFDLLNRDPSFPQWARAKSCDTFGPFGPVVAQGLDWRALRIRTFVNGRERQNYPAEDMILSPPKIVSLLSQEMTLSPGDVIACGTSLGALPMKPGTVVEIDIDGIGRLTNTFEPVEAST
jgi:2-keto-4-pentenoate hydratase/2-oxohepta-3-ene-1,7-dioic acid hydratase in catechol pathway